MPPREQARRKRGCSDEVIVCGASPPSVTSPSPLPVYTPSAVRAHVALYARADDMRAAVALAVTVVLYLGCFALPWWVLPLQSLLMMRLFIVAVHDAAHGALFSSRRVNDAVGSLLAPLAGNAYGYWQWGHAYHHEHSNDLDFEQWSQTAPITVREFRTWPMWKRAAFRALTVPVVLISVGAPLSVVVQQPLAADTVRDWALQLLWWAALLASGHAARYFAATVCASFLGLFLFHAQHTFVECVREHGRSGAYENAMQGSSLFLVPRWLAYFTAGIEYHHIHHLNAHVPFYKLRECHEAAPPGMWHGVKVMTFAEGWASLRLCMYDEDQRRLVTMAEFDAAASPPSQ